LKFVSRIILEAQRRGIMTLLKHTSSKNHKISTGGGKTDI
jgi:hypothetical protein